MPSESVDHPSHYGGDTTYEAIKVIRAWKLGFDLGNAVKYIARAGRKDAAKTIEDLRKARWYLDDEIRFLEAEEARKANPAVEHGRVLAEHRAKMTTALNDPAGRAETTEIAAELVAPRNRPAAPVLSTYTRYQDKDGDRWKWYDGALGRGWFVYETFRGEKFDLPSNRGDVYSSEGLQRLWGPVRKVWLP